MSGGSPLILEPRLASAVGWRREAGRRTEWENEETDRRKRGKEVNGRSLHERENYKDKGEKREVRWKRTRGR